MKEVERQEIEQLESEQKASDIAVDKVDEAEDVKVDDEDGDSSKVLIRREIRSLSEDEADRFWNAVTKMMENKAGKGTSEFFRLASYHGEPGPIYCQHGRETFPGWHRIYLMEFEKALQAADAALGNDGRIALPYWDWSIDPDQGLPKGVRERFSGWPEGFWPDSLKNNSSTYAQRRADDNSIGSQLQSWGVAQDAAMSLLAHEHWVHASTRFSGLYPSIESPHNSVHVIVGGRGGQMSGVAWAAFDIVFWLHHNNVDRIYESYLAIEDDSAMEFENFQDTQAVDMFDANFEPFQKEDGEYYSAKDTFSTKALGYSYDQLIDAPALQLREAPTVILFAQIKVYEFEAKCYQIHAFVVEEGKENEFVAPQTVDEIDYESPHYGGGAGVFGRGMECQNCVNRPPQDIVIDISDSLRALQLSRHSVTALILVLETTENESTLKPLSETPIPEPVITGPLFANTTGDELLDEDEEKSNDQKEVEALQRYLQKFGYYSGDRPIDGDYGLFTKQAVIDLQTATGSLKVDGIAGPKTRTAIVSNKRCDNIDPFASNDVVDPNVHFKDNDYAKTKEIKYFISVHPGYLKRNEVEDVIGRACSQWAEHSSLSFVLVDDKESADITFSWTMFNREDDPLRFDGTGGVLGRGGNGFVEFDLAERWVIGDDEKEISDLSDPKTWHCGQPSISLNYTALHELGHALGLVHSADPNDVMSPWYQPTNITLTENDIANLKKVLGNDDDEEEEDAEE